MMARNWWLEHMMPTLHRIIGSWQSVRDGVIACSTKQLDWLELIGDYVAVVQYNCPSSSHRPAPVFCIIRCISMGYYLHRWSVCKLLISAYVVAAHAPPGCRTVRITSVTTILISFVNPVFFDTLWNNSIHLTSNNTVIKTLHETSRPTSTD